MFTSPSLKMTEKKDIKFKTKHQTGYQSYFNADEEIPFMSSFTKAVKRNWKT